ncbi:MAG: hypothetical protein KF819_28675 [Labilithrix sp.]|nr:hypothetical protein [Labilithrix sp.]
MDSTFAKALFKSSGATAAVALLIVACGSVGSEFGEEGPPNPTFGDGSFNQGQPDGGDPYANDPPPKWCGPMGQPEPPRPGGTADCPDDKNKPGCGCTNVGEEAACWTGLRANRNLGVCKDGVTKCSQISENVKAWGPCVGQVLPTQGATKGKEACRCFSLGQWKLANLSPCFREYCGIDPGTGNPCPAANVTGYYAVSTHDDGTGGGAKCTAQAPTPPPALPPGPWTTDTLTVDCAGHFKLCYELKAGNFDAPSASDCTLTKQCVEADYLKENVEQAFPPLDAWVSMDQACAKKWNTTGGYGEMTVVGESVRCDKVDDGAGNAYVFNRVKYCPSICRDPANASNPECQNCQQGGSGQF